MHRGDGPLNTSLNFATAARLLGSFYEQALPSKSPARHRIDKLSHLSRLLGVDGVLQVEVCPCSSSLLSMSKKRALLREVAEGGFLTRYVASLRRFISPHPVVVDSAVSFQNSLHSGLEVSPWVTWQANIAGVHLDTAVFMSPVTKGTRVSMSRSLSPVCEHQANYWTDLLLTSGQLRQYLGTTPPIAPLYSFTSVSRGCHHVRDSFKKPSCDHPLQRTYPSRTACSRVSARRRPSTNTRSTPHKKFRPHKSRAPSAPKGAADPCGPLAVERRAYTQEIGLRYPRSNTLHSSVAPIRRRYLDKL